MGRVYTYAFKFRRRFWLGICSLSLLLLLGPQLTAQVRVSGRVVDAQENAPLMGAAVRMPDAAAGSYTDESGHFEFTAPVNPPFTLLISLLGYEDLLYPVETVDQPLLLKLKVSPIMLDGGVIPGNPIPDRKNQSPLSIEALSYKGLKDMASYDFYEGLGQLREVDVNSASIGFKVVNTRGFNSTTPVRSLQIIDGVDNQSPGLNFSLGNFLGVSELDVRSVELVMGASSAYYGPNAFNGVIHMKTKSPFLFPGVSVSLKAGERNLMEGALRYAQVFKNQQGVEKLAFKFNLYYFRAHDWEADNADEAYRDTAGGSSFPYVGTDNPGGYDAVNRYGDENLLPGQNNASSGSEQIELPGLNIWHRTGYWEADMVDYGTENLKSSLALHYRLTPEVELVASSAFSSGTTVYQADNRISLNDILFFQHRLEIRQLGRFFVRAYMTHEDAGNSYDAVFTALKLQGERKSDAQWSRDYRNHYRWQGIPDSVRMLEGFPPMPSDSNYFYDFSRADSVLAANRDDLTRWHAQVRDLADNRYLQPGSPEFKALWEEITSRPVNQGGTHFIDRSALFHLQGEYRFKPGFGEMVTGGNMRLFTPHSEGTIFLDTAEQIRNFEYGLYTGWEKGLSKDRILLNAALRLDKNQNFNFLLSPAFSAIWKFTPGHLIRTSVSSAIRNPTLTDQYLYYNVGRAILLGNLEGFDSLLTVGSFEDYLNSLRSDTLVYFHVDPIRPEKVLTFELGYRATLGERLYIDAAYYFNRYQDFIGYKLGVDAAFFFGLPTYVQAYRVAANADEVVTTQGFSMGLNFFLGHGLTLNGNYSWNRLNTEPQDPIIPAFNTPEHKFNAGITGRDIALGPVKHFGFQVNYKWIQGFLFEGSPQFTGHVPTYDLLDVQIQKLFPKAHTTLKIGASNLLDNKVYQVYGGPRIGRLAYLSLVFDWDSKRSE